MSLINPKNINSGERGINSQEIRIDTEGQGFFKYDILEKMLAAAYFCSSMIDSAGKTWAWGRHDSGEVGNGSTAYTSIHSPVEVFGNHRFKGVFGDGTSRHRYAIDENDRLWAWGDGANYALGQVGDFSDKWYPHSVRGNYQWANVNSCQGYISGILLNGAAYGWGGKMALGIGEATGVQEEPIIIGPAATFIKSATVYAATILLGDDGTLYATGNNENGKLGIGSAADNNTGWTQVSGGHTWVDIRPGYYHFIGLDDQGQAWGWGLGSSGQLGSGNLNNSSVPVSVTGNHSFVQIACGTDHAVGLKENGECWAWGDSYRGKLGDGVSTTDKPDPVLVHGDHKFAVVSCGGNHTLAFDRNGRLWGWGENAVYGALGDGTTVDRSIPTLIRGYA